MTGATTTDAFSVRWTRWLLAVIILAAAAVRFNGAWQSRVIIDPDGSVVALMAKHMALGLDFPVFFYGQLYMGSFEPAVSALLCRMFGVSGFMVNLGTVVVGLFLIPVVYLWGRDAGGRVAGLTAAAYCVIGSPKFLVYQYTPRGGYAAVVVLGTLVLFWSARLASSHRGRIFPANVMLGLVAGFGWWVDPLIVMALAAAVFVLMFGLRSTFFRPKFMLGGMIGFIVGGAPFWLWNAFHHWAGVKALLVAKSRPLSNGVAAFLAQGQRVTGLDNLPVVLYGAMLLVLVAAGIVALRHVILAYTRRNPDRSSYALLAALLMLVFTFFVYSTSQFSRENTTRYLTPMIPAVAVLFGYFISLCVRKHPAMAVVPLVITMFVQWPGRLDQKEVRAYSAAVANLVPVLTKLFTDHGIRAVYIDFKAYPLNFHSDENFVFALLENERSSFMAERVESDPAPAYMTANREILAFIQSAGGSVDRIDLGGGNLLHNLRPPAYARTELPAAVIAGGSSSDDPGPVDTVTDHQRSTYWYFRQSHSEQKWAEITLAEPQLVSGVRLLCPDKKMIPTFWRIEGQLEDERWVTLMPDSEYTLFFWSGPRAYYGGRYVRGEAMFDPVRIRSLRVVFPPDQLSKRWGISELSLFTPAQEQLAESTNLVPGLRSLLEQRGIDTMYADRWIANEVWHASGETMATSREKPRRPDTPVPERLRVEGRPGLGLLVRMDGVETTRAVLQDAGFTSTETPYGPWILFDTLSGSATNLEWSGFSALVR
jgi:hypothetical protein